MRGMLAHMFPSQVPLDQTLPQCQGLSIHDNWSDFEAVPTNGSYINMPVGSLFLKTGAFDFDNRVVGYRATHAYDPLVCEEAAAPKPLELRTPTKPNSKGAARCSHEGGFAYPPSKARRGI